MVSLLCAISTGICHAEGRNKPRDAADLDGIHLVLGPLGNATYADGSWDSAFGAEAGLYLIREHRALAVAGLTLGGAWFSAREGGRMWAHLEAGTQIKGVTLGFAAGPAVELDDIEPPRFGAQGTLWVFAGVIPYVRVGAVEEVGAFVDAGLRISLPTLRW
jgi:hypothetical protein